MIHTIRIAAIGLMASSAFATTAFADDKANPVEGAWRQVEQKNGDAQEYVKPPESTVMTDCIVGGRFIGRLSRTARLSASPVAATRPTKTNLRRSLSTSAAMAFPSHSSAVRSSSRSNSTGKK